MELGASPISTHPHVPAGAPCPFILKIGFPHQHTDMAPLYRPPVIRKKKKKVRSLARFLTPCFDDKGGLPLIDGLGRKQYILADTAAAAVPT